MQLKTIATLAIICFAQPCRFSYYKGNSFFDRLVPLSFIFATSVAVIHESYLKGWVDLKKLDPSRVKIVDSFVILKGPVWIIPSSVLRNYKIILTAVAAVSGVIAGYFLAEFLKPQTTTEANKQTQPIYPVSEAVGLVAGAALGSLTWVQLSKVIPKTTEIFFCNWPSFR